MGAVFAVAAVLLGLAAIVFVWRSMTGGSRLSDGTPGSVMDDGQDVRRIDMGHHAYAAQQAHGELVAAGLTTRLVTLEKGAFGIGLGEHYYLVYNAADEAEVRAVVDTYLEGLDDE